MSTLKVCFPQGLTYNSSSPISSNSGQNVYWSDIGSLAVNEKKQIWLKATIDGTEYGPLTNEVDVKASPNTAITSPATPRQQLTPVNPISS